jgi:membrane protease subunit (stomatin/prohibitin family)
MAIASIIKYEGGNDTFVWKHPCEDFNTATQLIVHESQEAVFFKDGVAYDSFGPGRYTLIADNLPRLRTVIGSLFGGADKTPFHCEVYFVNKVDVMTNKWATNHSIPVQDPMYKILLDVNASGQYGIKIENAKLFLVKLMGTTDEFTTATLNQYFGSLIITRVKDYLAKTMATEKISFLDIHAHLNTISESLRVQFEYEFQPYGFKLVNFFMDTIDVPHDSVGYKKLEGALAKKAEMNIVGYDYSEERRFDVLQTAAGNEGGAGAIAAAGVGLGVGIGAGKEVGKDAGQMLSGEPKTIECPNCHRQIAADSAFCNYCGKKVENPDAVVCPKCGAVLPAGSKFCNKCGAAVVETCPKCGAEMPAGSAFCPKCGAKKGE